MVFVPVGILVPTPLARRPSSFEKPLIQTSLSGPVERWRYSSDWPVTGSMTELAKWMLVWMGSGKIGPWTVATWLARASMGGWVALVG
jgi:hypothetical protein